MTKLNALPARWGTYKVLELFDVETGTTPSTREKGFWEHGNVIWITPSDLSKLTGRLYINESERKITARGLKESNLNLLPKGSIIISTRAPVGYVNVIAEPAAFNQGCKGLIAKNLDSVCPEFYYYYLLFKKKFLENQSSGSTFKELSKDALENLPISVPPLPEQRKIAEVLSTVDTAIQKVESAIEKIGRLKRGLMQRLLTRGIGHKKFKESEVGLVPEEWEVLQIGTITKEHKQGFYTNENYSEDGINLVRITDLQNPGISYSTMPKIKIDENIFKQFKVDVGDFLIARSGAIGRYGIVKNSTPCVFASYLIRFRFDNLRVDTSYFGKLFESFYISNELRKITQGATNKNINAHNIKKIQIPLPHLSEQCKIAEILGAVDEKLGLERRRREKLEWVKKGLMADLLTGRKRVAR